MSDSKNIMKVLVPIAVISFPLIGYCLGAIQTATVFNRPIERKTANVLTNLVCHKNDGLASFRRDYWDAKKYVVKCKDTAIFEQVGFTPEFEQVLPAQEKETDDVKFLKQTNQGMVSR